MENTENMENEKECCNERKGNRPPEVTRAIIVRLNKIEGQIRGIKTMLEKDMYCEDVLIQMSAVQSAMTSARRCLLENHLQTCIVPRIKEDDEEAVVEFMEMLKKMIK